MMKKSTILIVAGIAFTFTLSAHAVELTEELDLALDIKGLSDYRAGGISMTNNNSALWMDATLVHKKSGGHVGIFTSNIDFGTAANREFAYYLGIARPLSENIFASFSRLEYEYPSSSQFNFGEWIGTLSAYGATLGVKYTDDIKPFNEKRTIAWVEYEHKLPHGLSIDVRYGLTDTENDIYIDSEGSSRSTYYDWEIGIGKQQWGLDFRLSYIDTDLSKSECASSFGADDICSSTFVGSISKRF
ncbi:TorF family putative porin [Halomonas sp. M4R5S39]|uniref:TorF family putative porin n=1 Tax=Halomonas kalidii TaxID=3043293 RepID=UPI0024A9670C|nr:TorF family putative porin [Halomonas kalidii]MDI5983903.1 TorF family putative porin [Halomonas kalidii]